MPADSDNSHLQDEQHTEVCRESVCLDGLSPLELVELGLARMGGVEVSSSAQAARLMVQAESVARQAVALSIDLLSLSEHSGLHYGDGHGSAKNMLRHVAKLSGGDALGREQCRKMFPGLPLVGAAFRSGSLGTDQVRLLGRVFANVRVRRAMVGRQEWFLELAERFSFKRFQQRVFEWQRLIDEDGTEPPGDRTAANRNVKLVQDPTDLGWDLSGTFTSVDGAANQAVLDAFAKVLFDADWAEAKARVGDGVCTADLMRTDAQRRADAVTLIFATAAESGKPMAPPRFVHNIVWAESTFAEMVRRFAGAEPRRFDVDDYRCETIDDDPLDPIEAFANSVSNTICRVVVDAKSVVIDKGAARSFTGAARDAVRITGRECFWPGCWLPASRCETDHLLDHAKGGRTNPGNGAPGCGRHNRWKQKGYKVWRDDHGHIHVQRPDGTEIE